MKKLTLIFFLFLMSTLCQSSPIPLDIGQTQSYALGHDLKASPKGLAHIEWDEKNSNWKVTGKKEGFLTLYDSQQTFHIHILKPGKSWLCQVFKCDLNQIQGDCDDPDLFYKAKKHNNNKLLWKVRLTDHGRLKWTEFIKMSGYPTTEVSVDTSGQSIIKASPEAILMLQRSLRKSSGFSDMFFFHSEPCENLYLKTKAILVSNKKEHSIGLQPTLGWVSHKPSIRVKVDHQRKNEQSNIIAEPVILLDFQRPAYVQSRQNTLGWTFSLSTRPVVSNLHKIDLEMTLQTPNQQKHTIHTSMTRKNMQKETFLGSIGLDSQDYSQSFFGPLEKVPIIGPFVQMSQGTGKKQKVEFWMCSFSKNVSQQ